MKHIHTFITKSRFQNFLILLFCFSIILCSCSISDEKVNDHSIFLPETTTKSEKNVTACYLIIPANASSELIESANKLSLEISEKLDVYTKLYYDNEPLPSEKSARFIFVGNTSYADMQAKLARLKTDDFLCSAIGDHIFIGGKSDSATIAAIERFISDTLPYLDLSIKLEAEDQFEYFGEYLYNYPTLNGYPLNDYSIVYPQNCDMREKDIANALSQKLSEIFGVYPTVIAKNQAIDGQMMICVGACFGETATNAKILCKDNKITLCGSSADQIAQSAYEFINLCKDTDSIQLNAETAVKYTDPKITLMRVIPRAVTSDGALEEIVEVCREISSNKPTLVCFDFPTDTERTQYENNLSDYTYVGNGLFVLSDKYSLLSRNEVQSVLCADIDYGSNSLRVIVANEKDQTTSAQVQSETLCNISKSGTTVIFTLNNGESAWSANSDGVIVNDLQTNDSRGIVLTVFTINGSAIYAEDLPQSPNPASYSIFSITLVHPFLK